jgi:hypothetical protein
VGRRTVAPLSGGPTRLPDGFPGRSPRSLRRPHRMIVARPVLARPTLTRITGPGAPRLRTSRIRAAPICWPRTGTTVHQTDRTRRSRNRPDPGDGRRTAGCGKQFGFRGQLLDDTDLPGAGDTGTGAGTDLGELPRGFGNRLPARPSPGTGLGLGQLGCTRLGRYGWGQVDDRSGHPGRRSEQRGCGAPAPPPAPRIQDPEAAGMAVLIPGLREGVPAPDPLRKQVGSPQRHDHEEDEAAGLHKL